MERRPGNRKLRGIPIDENGAIAFEPLPSIAMEPMRDESSESREALVEIRRILQISPFTMAADVPAALEKKIAEMQYQINGQGLELERLKGKRCI